MKAFKTRIYPNAEQAVLIEKTFGCCRFVYNNGLECKHQEGAAGPLDGQA